MTPLTLVGGDAHCHSSIDVIESTNSHEIIGTVTQMDTRENPIHGYTIIEPDNEANSLLWVYLGSISIFGQVKTLELQGAFFQLVQDRTGGFPEVASTHLSVSRSATVSEDTINESHSYISTAARVNGGVSLGTGTFFGSSAVVNQWPRIGENCIIESAAVIPSDVTEGNHVTGEWQ